MTSAGAASRGESPLDAGGSPDPGTIVRRVAVLGGGHGARDLGREVLARFLPAMGAMTSFYGVDPHERPIRDRTLDLFVAAGTPADVARGVDRLVGAGAATVTFSGRLGPDPAWAIEALGGIVGS